ncbi:MAG: DUF2235 domain-containing protein [Thermoanaerobaculia bacterium]
MDEINAGDKWPNAYRTWLPEIARNAKVFHLVALHETRAPFRVEDIRGAIQMGLPGVHSDVGGGTGNLDLSDLALQAMLQMARAAGVRFNDRWDSAMGDWGACPTVDTSEMPRAKRDLLDFLIVPRGDALMEMNERCRAKDPNSRYWPRF